MLQSSIRLMGFTLLLAASTGACSASLEPAVAAAARAVECPGATVQSEGELAAYAACQSVLGDLRIEHSELTNLSALASLKRVSGKLVIANNPKLVSLAGLNGLEHAESVQISKNRMLAGYFGLLPDLARVEGELVLHKNRGLSRREIRNVLDRVAASEPVLSQTAARSDEPSVY